MVTRLGRVFLAFACTALVAASCIVPPPAPSAPNFQIKEVVSGITLPSAVRFSDDGRMFVAERAGRILAYDSVSDRSPTTVTDLSRLVTTMWDRGLLALELDPQFSSGRPYLYALFSYDAPPGGTAPTWTDDCIFAGFGNGGVCGITSGQLRKIEVGPDNKSVSETVLLSGWCQQFGGHSVADLEFAPDGSLFVSSGEGAAFGGVDWGQYNGNPCGDPEGEGGMLRSQDARTTGDPTGYSGAVIRIDPDTGAAWPTNAWAGDPDPDRAKIVAYGFREPFRMSFDPVAQKLYVAEVGWGLWEELNIVDVAATPPNFGWPCFEGPARQPQVVAAGVPMCESLLDVEHTSPAFAYAHSDPLGTNCGGGGTSITGVAVVRGNGYPAPYNNGIFMADYSRECIFFAPRAADGSYRFSERKTFATDARVVDLQVGPGGDLYFADILDGKIMRIIATGTNHSPKAVATATPDQGALPLETTLSGIGSSDPDPGQTGTLKYHWDLDDDGAFDDATGSVVSHTFTTPGTTPVRLRVTDTGGATDEVSIEVLVGNTAPVPVIDLPAEATITPGTDVDFAGYATDAEDGTLPATSLSWNFVIQHCTGPNTPEDCHQHDIASMPGVDSGEFEMPAHEAPSFLDVILTATDSQGVSRSATVTLGIGE